MIKVHVVLALMAALMALSSASDWLEGGYVGQGSYSDISQHFTDPIFYSSGNHYSSSDPAIRQMEESMDRYSSRHASLGSSTTGLISKPTTSRSTIGKSNLGKSASALTAAVQSPDAAGSWHMELSDSTVLGMDLSQSGTRVFGIGSLISPISTEWATASGDITGSILRLDVVPADGRELYSISIDISRLHLPGSFTLFRARAIQLSGNVRASRVA